MGPAFPGDIDYLSDLWVRFVNRFSDVGLTDNARLLAYSVTGDEGVLDPDNAFLALESAQQCGTEDGEPWLGFFFVIGGRVRVAILFPALTERSVAFYATPVDPDIYGRGFEAKLNWYMEGFCTHVVMKTEEYLLSPGDSSWGGLDIES